MNAILPHPVKSRNAAKLRDATLHMLNWLRLSGRPPALHIMMDNEASDTLKRALNKHKITYHLVPLHLHRRNAAKRAIQTFNKAHFILCLCTAHL